MKLISQDAVKLTLEPKSFPDPVDICSDVVQRREVQGLGHTHVKMGKWTTPCPKGKYQKEPFPRDLAVKRKNVHGLEEADPFQVRQNCAIHFLGSWHPTQYTLFLKPIILVKFGAVL